MTKTMTHEQVMKHVLLCDECFTEMARIITAELTRKAGATKSPAKSKAARENGKKGGRPRKS